jgi:hypothetical protein
MYADPAALLMMWVSKTEQQKQVAQYTISKHMVSVILLVVVQHKPPRWNPALTTPRAA